MTTWIQRQTTQDTDWELESDSITQTWMPDAGGAVLGEIEYAAGSTATYTSGAQAASSLVGSRYHLFDQKEMFFGTDQDLRLSFEGDGSGLVVKAFPSLSGGDGLFTVRNGDNDMIQVRSDASVMFRNADVLPEDPMVSSIVFFHSDLYIKAMEDNG